MSTTDRVQGCCFLQRGLQVSIYVTPGPGSSMSDGQEIRYVLCKPACHPLARTELCRWVLHRAVHDQPSVSPTVMGRQPGEKLSSVLCICFRLWSLETGRVQWLRCIRRIWTIRPREQIPWPNAVSRSVAGGIV